MPFCHPPSKKESTCQDVLLLESLMLMWPSHVLSDASDSDAALCYCFIGFHCSVPDTQTQTGHFLWAEASRSDFVIHLIISAERYNLIRKHVFICPIYFQHCELDISVSQLFTFF